MSTQGRKGGTRSRPRRPSETANERMPAASAEATAPAATAQLLEDRATPIAGPRGRRVGRSFGGALVGTLVVAGLALGAALGPGGLLGSTGDGQDTTGDTATVDARGAGHPGQQDSWTSWQGDGTDVTAKPSGDDDSDGTKDGDTADPTDKPTVEATDKPEPEPTEKPKPESTPKATPKPTPKPDPTKAPDEPIALVLAIKDYHPKLEWGSCEGLDFDYYKVVRSKDSTVSWPTGGNDSLVGAVEAGGYRKAWDKDAPHDVKVWYRVFCVRKTDAGYKVVQASATKGIEVPAEPAPPPPPDPIALELDFTLTDGGKVVLGWSACDVDGFAFYKVVKSTSNDDPSYFPWTDGTEVIGVVSEMFATEWQDWAPDSGHTAYYRVQCLGYVGDQKVLLGESAVVTVTTP